MIYKIFAEIYLILPHSGSQKRQNWDEVKWGKMRLTPPPQWSVIQFNWGQIGLKFNWV